LPAAEAVRFISLLKVQHWLEGVEEQAAVRAQVEYALHDMARRHNMSPAAVKARVDELMEGHGPYEIARRLGPVAVADGDEEDKLRDAAIRTPHALDWTFGSGDARPLPNAEFIAGLGGALRLDIAKAGQGCPSCGQEVEKDGSHLARCSSLVSPCLAHNSVRDAIAQYVRRCHMVAEVEATAGSELRTRPGDILIPAWQGGRPGEETKALYKDVSITAQASDGSRLDAIAAAKTRLYKPQCLAAGGTFRPLVADAWGAWHPSAIAYLRRLAEHLDAEQPWRHGLRISGGQQMWRTLSTLVVSRATRPVALAWVKGLAAPWHPGNGLPRRRDAAATSATTAHPWRSASPTLTPGNAQPPDAMVDTKG
jgi:hypothetical protein